MEWQLHLKAAESALANARVPSSQELVTLIKRVNPTCLQLPEHDREYGYSIKNRLQNLLLETYGEIFHLAPHPYNPDIILIKHNALPSVDACHADVKALSLKALDTVGSIAPATAAPSARRVTKAAKSSKPTTGGSPKETLRNAELLLEKYEYPQAEELLAAIRIADVRELPTLVKAARMLVEEMGAYPRAIELLLAQPRQVLKDKVVRELLAMTYYGNGLIAEARALFEAAHPGDLEKSSLYAYADLSFKDGNISQAYHLLKLSDEKEGFVTSHASLRKEIEAAMLKEAEPYLRRAEAAFAAADLAQAEDLLQQAISLYPNFKKARELAGEVEAQKDAAQAERLWEQFGSCAAGTDRLDLLAQLLELDKDRAGEIRDLMARERNLQKQGAVEDRLSTLRTLAAQQCWEECFENLIWFAREGEEADHRRACDVSPYFSVFYQNKKLRRLESRDAMEQWLKFVRLKRQMEQGQTEDCLDLLQDLKPYFHSYPSFRKEYEQVLELESAKASEEAQQLLTRLQELERSEGETDALAKAKRLVAQMQKPLALLPADERSDFKQDAKFVLDRLENETECDDSILDYREALILGNAVKAAKLREQFEELGMEQLVKWVDDEVAQKFALSAEPISMTVSPDLAVDLATEFAPYGLTRMCFSKHHIMFREDDETIILLNMRRMTATRYRSPNFKDLAVMDILPDRDVFLFVNIETKNNVWRATLSDIECGFTALFEVNQHFSYQEGAGFEGLFMSSNKDNCYYAVISEGCNFRVIKQSLDLVSSTVSTYEAAGLPQQSLRLSYHPDKLVIGTENSTVVLESNLTPPRGCSRVGSNLSLDAIAIDTGKNHIYAHGDGIVNVLNTRLRAVKQYLNASSAGHMEFPTVSTVCPEKDLVVIRIEDRNLFYNMRTNQFSQKFMSSRFLYTETPARCYYWEFADDRLSLKIKDITDELNTLLEWEVFLPAGEDENAGIDFVRKLEDPDYFSIVKRAPQQKPAEVSSEDQPVQ
uniref:Tetratricopeptide TPR_2 repeat protein n=1 Tax=Geobacter sp. (strain M21) TaxID=443144 RepID=C6E4A2_GEOSM